MSADSNATLVALVGALPHPLAVALRDYLEEKNDYVKLWRLCEAAEMLTRFLTAIALAELSGAGQPPFPLELQAALREGLRTPMFGSWVGILDQAARAVAARSDVLVPELPPLVTCLLQDVSPRGERRVERAILDLRNALAHDGRFPLDRARALLDEHGHARRFERLWQSEAAAFLARLELLGITDSRACLLLCGAAKQPGAFPAADTTDLWPLGSCPHEAGSIVLARRDEPRYLGRSLPLFPLQAYGRVLHNRGGRTEAVTDEAVAQVYVRHQERIRYTALHPREGQSEGTSAMQRAFDQLFPLRAWQDAVVASEEADLALRQLSRSAAEFRFRDVIEATSAAPFVGRDSHLAAVLTWLEQHDRGSGLVLGHPGMGKTALAARLATQIAREHKDWLCLRYFFKADDARCSTRAFLRGVLLQVRLAGADETVLPDDPARARDAFRAALAAFAADHLGPGRSHARLVLLVDGLDEIAPRDPHFFELMTGPAVANVVWLGFARPEEAVRAGLPEPPVEPLFGTGGLPPLDQQAVREFLLDELSSLRRKQLLEVESDQGDCPFLSELVKRAGGLPLYLRLLVEDLHVGQFRFDRPEELPKSLLAYYDRLTDQFVLDDARKVLPDVVALLAVARTPLTAGMLRALLGDHELRGDPEWDEVFDSALRLGHVLVRSAHLWEGVTGQTLYHPSYRDYLLGGKTKRYREFRMAATLRKARQRVLGLCRRWRDWPEGSDERRYALQFAAEHFAEHFKEAGDIEGLAGLVRDGYLRAVADHPALRIEGALERGRAIAEALKDAGPQRWDDFESCAAQYCDLAESARAALLSLPGQIEAGQVEPVLTLIGSLADFYLRGVAKLAAGVLFAEAGEEGVGQLLREEGAVLVRAQLAGGGDLDLHPVETRQIAGALLKVLDEGGQGVVGRHVPWEAVPAADVSVRADVPLRYRALAYLMSPGWGFFLLSSGLLLFIYGTAADSALWALPCGLPCCVAPFCLLFLPVFLGQRGVWGRGLDRLMRGLDRAAHAAPSQERRAILARALDFALLLRLMPEELKTWAVLLPAWVAERFRLCATPEEASEVVFVAAHLGDASIDALAGEMVRPDAHEILRLALSKRFRMPDPWPLVPLAAAMAQRSGDEGLLLKTLRQYNRLAEQSEKMRVVPILAAVPPAILARALLASLEADHRTGRQGWLDGLVERLAFRLVRVFRLRMRGNSRAGLYFSLVLLAPFLACLCLGLVVLVPGLFFLSWLAGRMHDPYRLASSSAGGADLRRRLTRRLQAPSMRVFSDPLLAASEGAPRHVSLLVAPLQRRRLRDAVLAQGLLREEGVDTAGYSAGALRRAVAALAGARLLTDPAKLVLKFLGDRKVLTAVAPLGRRGAGAARTVPEAKDHEELVRLLPLASARLSFLLVFGVALLGVGSWLAALFLMFPGDTSSWLPSFAVAECVALCAFLALMQHLPGPGSRLWPFRDEPVVGAAVYQLCGGVVSLVVVGVVHASVLAVAEAAGFTLRRWAYGPDGPHLLVPLVALLMTNLVAPELIARWRGAGLLYPSNTRRWLQRLVCSGMLAALAVVLALVAHVLGLADS